FQERLLIQLSFVIQCNLHHRTFTPPQVLVCIKGAGRLRGLSPRIEAGPVGFEPTTPGSEGLHVS
ncbi:MAG: hypothetical protein JRN52_16270, partial [Nitrososphaerota archaeon]|nr:hypothetical protein [Nitrososphaerota archaeon]